MRVPYVPQSVRDGIRDEVRQDVMAQARSEGWAAPNEVAEWTKRIKVTGDMRVRSESRFFSERNSDIVSNWSSINSGNGFDTNTNTNLQLPPLLNTRQDRRNLWRIRARLGIEATIGQHTTAGVRLASGSSNGPVSTTEQLGGGLSKKDVWLDQAWLAYSPADWVTVRGGRFGNPFWTSDTLFSNDLNFDGLAANLQYDVDGGDLGLFGNLAVVPLEYTSDSSPSQSRVKTPNENKWLSGAQVGVNWRFNDENALRAALGYYDFKNISGRLSSPCALYAGAVGCDTDWSRPAFMQKGNTLMLIRDIARNPLDPANTPTPQYVGLASAFRLATLNLRWDTAGPGHRSPPGGRLHPQPGLRQAGHVQPRQQWHRQQLRCRRYRQHRYLPQRRHGMDGAGHLRCHRAEGEGPVAGTAGLQADRGRRAARCLQRSELPPRWHQCARLLRGGACAGRAQLDQRQVDGGQGGVRCPAVDRRVPAGVQYRLLSGGVMRFTWRVAGHGDAPVRERRPRVVQKEEWMSRRKLFESPEPSSQMLGAGPAYVSVEGLRQHLAEFLLYAGRPVVIMRGRSEVGYFLPARCWRQRDDDPLAAAAADQLLDAAGFEAEDIQQVEQEFNAMRQRTVLHSRR